MKGFLILFCFGLKRRIKDFFIIIYNIVYPLILILLLGYIAVNFFKGDSSVTSYDYYTFVMIPFFIFSSIITMSYVAKDESLYKTAYRFIAAPIGSKAIVISKIISCTIVVWLCTLLIVVISKILLGVNWGVSLPLVLFLFFSEALMASAAGIYLGTAFNNFNTLKGILNVPLNVFAMLGGSFFPVGSLGSSFEKVSYVSPLTWINKGIMAAVYDNNTTMLKYSIILMLVLAAIFSILAVTSFKKEAFLQS